MFRRSFALTGRCAAGGCARARARVSVCLCVCVCACARVLTARAASLQVPAKNATLVHGIGNITSYAGFVNVNETNDNNLFFWYFPAQDGNTSAPLLVWLQGGPGGASTFGLLVENGPFYLDANLTL